jgi:hypothetical protein
MTRANMKCDCVRARLVQPGSCAVRYTPEPDDESLFS